MAIPDTATRYEKVSSSLSYLGKASVGSLDAQPVWKIKKIEKDLAGVLSVKYAGTGNSNFAWTDRASLSYT